MKYGDESTRQIGLHEPQLSKLDRCFTFAVHYSVMSSKETISTQYASYNLDHFGMVAGMVDELGIVETIDTLIVQDFDQRLVSVGTLVKAMILNGLGYINRTLYLMPDFFRDKPVERLLGQGITAEQLNDDALGRALDSIFDYGVESLYSQVAASAMNRLGLLCPEGHLDSTSFHTDGKYNSEAESTEGVIQITKGYSRDHRPDLNQVVLQMITDGQAGIPILMQPLSGNNSDQNSFRATVDEHIKHLNADFGMKLIVADSALFNEKSLAKLGRFPWVSRVPETITAAKELIKATAEALMQTGQEQAHCSLGVVYAKIKQRWLVVYSEAARHRVQKTLCRQHLKQSSAKLKAFDQLCRQSFNCTEDAQAALAKFEKGLSLMFVSESQIKQIPQYKDKGRPRKDQTPDSYIYQIEGQLACKPDVHNQKLLQKSCFILATNQLDELSLSDAYLIEAYKKDQQKVERGFRFLKDPRFMASTLFLKSPTRIMALMMVMTLCLMVYAALEWRIRQSLKESQKTFPSQQAVANNKPTARWVFQCFSGIHLLKIGEGHARVLNLNKHHRSLLTLLGKQYVAIYADTG